MCRVANGANSTGAVSPRVKIGCPAAARDSSAFLARLVAHLLDADDEHDVVHAARDRHRADAERVGTRRARVLDARARDAGEADRGRDRVAADAFLAPQRAALGRDERGLDLRRARSPCRRSATAASNTPAAICS